MCQLRVYPFTSFKSSLFISIAGPVGCIFQSKLHLNVAMNVPSFESNTWPKVFFDTFSSHILLTGYDVPYYYHGSAIKWGANSSESSGGSRRREPPAIGGCIYYYSCSQFPPFPSTSKNKFVILIQLSQSYFATSVSKIQKLVCNRQKSKGSRV